MDPSDIRRVGLFDCLVVDEPAGCISGGPADSVCNGSMDARRVALALVFVDNASGLITLLESKSRQGEGVEHPSDDRRAALLAST
jgi:hypothetical protein